jgi:hypothetical protein
VCPEIARKIVTASVAAVKQIERKKCLRKGHLRRDRSSSRWGKYHNAFAATTLPALPNPWRAVLARPYEGVWA